MASDFEKQLAFFASVCWQNIQKAIAHDIKFVISPFSFVYAGLASKQSRAAQHPLCLKREFHPIGYILWKIFTDSTYGRQIATISFSKQAVLRNE